MRKRTLTLDQEVLTGELGIDGSGGMPTLDPPPTADPSCEPTMCGDICSAPCPPDGG